MSDCCTIEKIFSGMVVNFRFQFVYSNHKITKTSRSAFNFYIIANYYFIAYSNYLKHYPAQDYDTQSKPGSLQIYKCPVSPVSGPETKVRLSNLRPKSQWKKHLNPTNQFVLLQAPSKRAFLSISQKHG